MWPDGSEAHSEPMLNYEITQVLAHERQHELAHTAGITRMARRLRRSRRNDIQADIPVDYTIVLPRPVRTHAVAA